MDLLTSLTPTAKLTNCSGGKVFVPTEAQFTEILVLETSEWLCTLICTLMKGDS